MRLFVALPIPGSGLARLEECADAVRRACRRGSFSRTENLHITLSFLGETEPERLEEVKRCLSECSSPPLHLTVGAPELFRGNGGDTLVRRVTGGEELYRLQKTLSDALRAALFPQEDRPFRPHLTLARRMEFRPGADLASLSREIRPFSIQEDRMILYRSDRIDGVLTYTPLFTRMLNE